MGLFDMIDEFGNKTFTAFHQKCPKTWARIIGSKGGQFVPARGWSLWTGRMPFFGLFGGGQFRPA
jgi:hypothetical protein